VGVAIGARCSAFRGGGGLAGAYGALGGLACGGCGCVRAEWGWVVGLVDWRLRSWGWGGPGSCAGGCGPPGVAGAHAVEPGVGGGEMRRGGAGGVGCCLWCGRVLFSVGGGLVVREVEGLAVAWFRGGRARAGSA